MPIRGRGIAFHEEMAVPSKPISDNRGQKQEPPLDKQCCEQKHCCAQGSEEVPTPCGGLSVLIHIERPELFQASEMHPECESFEEFQKEDEGAKPTIGMVPRMVKHGAIDRFCS